LKSWSRRRLDKYSEIPLHAARGDIFQKIIAMMPKVKDNTLFISGIRCIIILNFTKEKRSRSAQQQITQA